MDCDVVENDVVLVNFLNISNIKRFELRELELIEFIGFNGNLVGILREGRKVLFVNFLLLYLI